MKAMDVIVIEAYRDMQNKTKEKINNKDYECRKSYLIGMYNAFELCICTITGNEPKLYWEEEQ